ncbi:hypothetical protein RHECNPAF_1340031 [Rhizobium etli CNPAF512]|nr:hypothetical protein RHECNPAF_1340031 [Rhizobium etli CNPAF512]
MLRSPSAATRVAASRPVKCGSERMMTRCRSAAPKRPVRMAKTILSIAASGLGELWHGEVDHAGTAGRRRIEQGQHQPEAAGLRQGQPVARLRGGGDFDREAAVGLAQHRPGIQRRGKPGLHRRRIAAIVGGKERPQPGGWRLPADAVAAAGIQPRPFVVDARREGQPLGAAIKQLAGARPVRFGVGIGIDRLQRRKSLPGAKLDRSETLRRIQRIQRNHDPAAKGDDQRDQDEKGESKHVTTLETGMKGLPLILAGWNAMRRHGGRSIRLRSVYSALATFCGVSGAASFSLLPRSFRIVVDSTESMRGRMSCGNPSCGLVAAILATSFSEGGGFSTPGMARSVTPWWA